MKVVKYKWLDKHVSVLWNNDLTRSVSCFPESVLVLTNIFNCDIIPCSSPADRLLSFEPLGLSPFFRVPPFVRPMLLLLMEPTGLPDVWLELALKSSALSLSNRSSSSEDGPSAFARSSSCTKEHECTLTRITAGSYQQGDM